VSDVRAVVDYARGNGLRVAIQGTGHGAAPLAPLDDVILLRTGRMDGVEIDAAAARARVEAGALWGEVAVRAGEQGLAPLAGSSPDVGVVGYTLGGGVGWLTRRYGLACNSVVAIEVVTADGEEVRVDHDREADLFWALRGGGGSFAAVTALEFTLYPVAEVFAGMLVWPAELGADAVAAYRAWTRNAPDEASSAFRYLNLPPLPEIPEPLRGRSVVAFDAAYLGPAEEGDELLRPLRETGQTLVDTFGRIPAAELRHLHGDPEQPSPGIVESRMLRELNPEALEAYVAVGGPASGSPLLGLELRHLGGAVSEAPPGAGALGSLEGEFILGGVGLATSPDSVRAIKGHLAAVTEAMTPWAVDSSLLNFSERSVDLEPVFGSGTYGRLREVKSRYDAEDLFLANHPIPSRA
jgi:hypothetical protein